MHVLDDNFSVLTNLGFAKMCECVGLKSFRMPSLSDISGVMILRLAHGTSLSSGKRRVELGEQ
jgi:hypothetical protein